MASDAKVALSFTGGKDSSLVLHVLQLQSSQAAARLGPEAARLRSLIPDPLTAFHSHSVECLVTFVPKNALRPFKAHPLTLVSAQAAAVNIPHKVCEVGEPYLESYQRHIRALRDEFGIELLATGDIEDVCSGFMHKAVAGTGVQLCKPLWQLPRTCILDLTWKLGLRPVISCTHIPKFATSSPALLQHCRALLMPSDPTPLDTLNNSTPGAQPYPAEPLDNSTIAADPASDPAAAADIAAAAPAAADTQQPVAATPPPPAPVSPLLTVRDGRTEQSLGATAPVLLLRPEARDGPCSVIPGDAKQQHAGAATGSAGPLGQQGQGPGQGQGQRQGQGAQGQAAATCKIAEWLVGAELGPPVHEALLRPLGTLGVDAGGEYGEYHTMVLDGPLFERAVRVEAARKVEEEYCFLEVLRVELVDKQGVLGKDLGVRDGVPGNA